MDPKHNAAASDKASIKSTNTFGSTIGLLKDKAGFSSSSATRKDSSADKSDAQKSAKDSSKILRNQVNIIG